MTIAGATRAKAPLTRVFDRFAPSRLVVPVFLVFWSLAVLVPIGVIVLFSFFQVRYYKVVMTPTLDT